MCMHTHVYSICIHIHTQTHLKSELEMNFHTMTLLKCHCFKAKDFGKGHDFGRDTVLAGYKKDFIPVLSKTALIVFFL